MTTPSRRPARAEQQHERPDGRPELRVAVVGGGLSGLCAGLALARAGRPVTIIERATGEPPGGAGLGLDRSLLARVTGTDAARIPVVSGNRPSAAWGLVRQFLLEAALAAPGIEFIESVAVTGVRDHGQADPVTLDSTAAAVTADVVVGADGVYSVTRRFVAPGQPAASYAGYMLWRGLVAESDVPGGLGGRGRDVEVHAAPGARLVIYCVPGPDGRTMPAAAGFPTPGMTPAGRSCCARRAASPTARLPRPCARKTSRPG